MTPSVLFHPAMDRPLLVRTLAAAVYGWLLYNPTGADAFLQLFDAIDKDVELGVTQPVLVIPINAGDYEKELPSAGVMAQANASVIAHLETKKGLTIAATTEPMGSTPAPVMVNLFYS